MNYILMFLFVILCFVAFLTGVMLIFNIVEAEKPKWVILITFIISISIIITKCVI